MGFDIPFNSYGKPHQSVAPESDPLSAVYKVSVEN